MIVFRTDVSQYTIRSGPNGPGPHIRRVHFNRPDRYNFFREIRDFRCAGEGNPLVWHWPRGGEVVSADITSIEVHTPNGNVRYDPERDRLRRERRRAVWQDERPASVPFAVSANSTFGNAGYVASAVVNEQRGASLRADRQQAWQMYLRGLADNARQEFGNLANYNPCNDRECTVCIEILAERLVAQSYICPLAVWEMELMDQPYENLINSVRPPRLRPSPRLRDFTSPPEQVPVQEEDPFNHLPF